ncbi:MAG: hypothetical protein ACP5N0_02395 [Methanosarcina sp.]
MLEWTTFVLYLKKLTISPDQTFHIQHPDPLPAYHHRQGQKEVQVLSRI